MRATAVYGIERFSLLSLLEYVISSSLYKTLEACSVILRVAYTRHDSC